MKNLHNDLEEAFNIIGTSMYSDDFCCKLFAWLYVFGGGCEVKFFILNDQKEVVVTTDISEYLLFSGQPDNRIVKQDVVGTVLVSTVFLAEMAHNENVPLLFETMVFDELTGDKVSLVNYPNWPEEIKGCFRTRTYEAAQERHGFTVALLQVYFNGEHGGRIECEL